MPGDHAKLSASGAKKWIACPGSVALEGTMPETESEYATEGTAAHALGEAKIRLALKELTHAKYNKVVKGLSIDPEMENYTDEYRDYVIERLNSAKARSASTELLLETRLDFSEWVPEGFGTADAIILSEGLAEIIDLKYGKGVQVDAADNPQLKLYALGALDAFNYLYGIDRVIMTIYQPRLNSISSEEASAKELLDWGEQIRARAEAAYSEEGPCVCGQHCDDGFCRARPICREYAEHRLECARFDLCHPSALSADEIAEILEKSATLAKWSKLVADYALDQAVNHGAQFPGYKVVEGRSNRQWSAADADIAALLTGQGYREDDIWPRKLKSITEIEKLLSRKRFSEVLGGFVVKPDGRPTLAPIEDSRPALGSDGAAQTDFKDYIEKGD